MNGTAASCGVSKEIKLLLRSILLLNVLLHHHLVTMSANCTDEIAIAPELPTPQLLLNFWAGLEYFSGRYTFDNLHQLLRAIQRHGLHQKMHMVPIRAYFQKLNLVALTNL